MRETKPFKPWYLILLGVIILFAIGNKIYSSLWTKATVKISGKELRVLVADTYDHRFQGWSNKKNMGRYQGMLFVFPDSGRHAMVMRDMYFPLDIVWLNGNTVVDIAPKLPPEAGRSESQLTLYQARTTSTLVLELPSGFMEQNGLKIGDTVEIIKD